MGISVATLETARLFLRPIALEHAPSYARHFVDYEVIRHLAASVPWPYPTDGVEGYFRTVLLPEQGGDRWAWGIFLKENSDECIGCVDLWRNGRPENRGFWLGRNFWGRGIMSEATEAVTTHAFENLGFEKLILSNAVGNVRSRRIKVKAGARLLGTRPMKFVDPLPTEAETWELTREQWEGRKPAQRVLVIPYDPEWINRFAEIEKNLRSALGSLEITIEHVGSTSVPGLAAKPVIDIDIVVPDNSYLPQVVEKLATLGYKHLGDLGVREREAFRATSALWKHNLYVCPRGSISLQNHLALREALRADPLLREEYGVLKLELARKHFDSIEAYIEGKTDFILRILAGKGFGANELSAIRGENAKRPPKCSSAAD